ncbi:MAG TPA: hypothetical protein VMU68_04865 [Acidimicrobiales bacterium]|nr:hypothetical protein [Acidimicrobiales bacterium]
MRVIRKLLGLSTPKTQNTSLLEPTSMAAFGHLSGSEQSILAEALVAAANERRKLDKAS